MANEQIMNKAIAKAVAKAMRVAIQAKVAATGEQMQSIAGPKLGSPSMKQPMFIWEADDKYNELKTIKLEVNNILSTYNSPQNEQLAMVKKWLGRKRLQFIEGLMNEEKTTCNTLDGLFETLKSKFRPQFNETIKSLQFRKLCRSDNESLQEWMGRLQIVAAESSYQELRQTT